MTLFGDALKAFNKARSLQYLPHTLMLKGIGKGAKVVKEHTFLGKKVRDEQGNQKHIWRGSRFLKKHAIIPLIKKTAPAISLSRSVYQKIKETTEGFEQKTQVPYNLSQAQNPSLSPEEAKALQANGLVYDPVTQTTKPKPLPPTPSVIEQDLLQAFAPRNDIQSKMLAQKFISQAKNGSLEEKDVLALNAFGFNYDPSTRTLSKRQELPLTPLEKEICQFCRYTGDMKTPDQITDKALQFTIRSLRRGKVPFYAHTALDGTNLRLENGKLVKTTQPLPPSSSLSSRGDPPPPYTPDKDDLPPPYTTPSRDDPPPPYTP